jgi:predicted HAD superfamily phosphohydrolase
MKEKSVSLVYDDVQRNEEDRKEILVVYKMMQVSCEKLVQTLDKVTPSNCPLGQRSFYSECIEQFRVPHDLVLYIYVQKTQRTFRHHL